MSADCPYGANACPKIEEIEDRIEAAEQTAREQSADIKRLIQYVGILMGMVAINWGISIW